MLCSNLTDPPYCPPMFEAIIILSILLAIAIAVIVYLLSTRPSPSAMAKQEDRFRAMAAEIFAFNNRQMREDNERRLSELLTPVRENFAEFRKAFQESYNREAQERFSLQNRIRDLITQSDAIGREARELSNALKGNNRVQGQWGEMILQSILSRSGLRQGAEYDVQVMAENESGDRLRPDAVISFPDGRKIVIDSKASLKSYLEMADVADQARQRTLLRLHVASLRNHINELRVKNYQAYIGSAHADFVLMFIPNEGAYVAGMQADDSLWQFAYDSNVILVSPTHLMSVVKLVEQSWRHDKQDKNALEIAVEGGRLIDKLCSFIADMESVDAALDKAKKAYDSAMTKLNGRGGIVSRAEKLGELGAKASRKLPSPHGGKEIEEK